MKLKFLKMSLFTVTLEALGDAGFKGFNLQAREVDGDVPIGTFKITDPNTKGLECHNMTVCVQALEYLLKLGVLLNNRSRDHSLYSKAISSVEFKKNFLKLSQELHISSICDVNLM